MADRTTDPRPRIPDELAARIDAVRGDVLFGTWVVRACELRLAGALEAAPGGPTGSRVEVPGVSPPAPAPPPRAPRKPRKAKGAPVSPYDDPEAHKEALANWNKDEEPKPSESAPEPPEVPEPGDDVSPDAGTPSVVQLAQRAGVPLSVARRWLESGEWAMYWP